MNNQQNNKNDKNDKDNKKKNAKILAIFLIVSILGTFFFNSILTKWRNGTEKTISYNKFVTMLEGHRQPVESDTKERGKSFLQDNIYGTEDQRRL